MATYGAKSAHKPAWRTILDEERTINFATESVSIDQVPAQGTITEDLCIKNQQITFFSEFVD